jgi:hypothetical protein
MGACAGKHSYAEQQEPTARPTDATARVYTSEGIKQLPGKQHYGAGLLDTSRCNDSIPAGPAAAMHKDACDANLQGAPLPVSKVRSHAMYLLSHATRRWIMDVPGGQAIDGGLHAC